MTFYHGSPFNLSAGGILKPGSEIGVSWHGRSSHVYLTHDGFSMTEVEDYIPETVRMSSQYALYSAIIYASWAADISCSENSSNCLSHHTTKNHSTYLQKQTISPCAYVYEVQPLGPITDDGAHDVGPEACRTTEAIITKQITQQEMMTLLNWKQNTVQPALSN